MSISTVLTAHPGSTVIVYLSVYPTEAYIVGPDDSSDERRTKLQAQEALYSAWLMSAQDPTRSSGFPNGRLSGYYSGYGGSLYFIEEEDGRYRLVFAHIFEDFTEEEFDPQSGTSFKKAKKTGLELAKAFEAGKELGAFRCKLTKLGFQDISVRQLRYKQGGGI